MGAYTFQNCSNLLYNRMIMSKAIPTKLLLILLYGYPGAGKTHFGKQLSDIIGAAHVNGDRIRYELFEQPRYDKQENAVISHLMQYMTEEFLNSGVSVIYDANAMRVSQRRALRDMARKVHAAPLLIWLQIDAESAFTRTSKRDRRKNDDKYATPYDRPAFDNYIRYMQNPQSEDYIVVSGKHTFNAQKSAVVKKLYEMGLISADNTSANVVKPGLVNLVPKPLAGRVDISRRNIIIR